MKKNNLIVALMLMSVSIFGQNGVSKISLSLKQAIDKSVEYNKALQNASYDLKVAQAKRWQSIASMLPQASLGYNYQNMMGYTMEFRIPGMNPATGEEDVTVLSRETPPNGIFDINVGAQISGQQIVGVIISNIALDMSVINRAQTQQATESTTLQLYMSILANQKIVELLNSSKGHIDRIYEGTKKSVEVGVLEQNEADKLYVQVMKLESSINAAYQGLELLYNSFKLHLGIDADSEIILTDKIDDLNNPEAILELLHKDFVIEQSYSYQLLNKNLELSKRQIVMAAMGYSPKITIGYRYSNIKYYGGEPMMNMNPPNVFSIGLSIPLFTSGRVLEAIQEKKYEYLKTKNTFADTENQLKIKNKQLRFNLNSTYENFQIQKRNIEVANKVFNSVSEKFRYGKASSLEVTQSSNDLILAQNAYIQSIIDMTNAQIELKKLLNQ